MKDDIIIRRAELRDMKAVFDLNNDAVVRATSIHTEPIAWEGHQRWFAKAISNPSLIFFVIETQGGDFIGEVRFALEDEGWVITIHLQSAYRGKGLGSAIMRQAIAQSKQSNFVAYAKPHNAASAHLFSGLGFESTGITTLRSGDVSAELLRFQLEGSLS